MAFDRSRLFSRKRLSEDHGGGRTGGWSILAVESETFLASDRRNTCSIEH